MQKQVKYFFFKHNFIALVELHFSLTFEKAIWKGI